MGYIAQNHLGEHWSRPDDEAQTAISEGLQQAQTAVGSDQREAAAFLAAHGAEVVAGHPPVRKAGAQGDPQLGMEPTNG
jgi:hypothetical protein